MQIENYKDMTLENIDRLVKNELEKYEHCFNFNVIFPFYLHETRINVDQIQILEDYNYIKKGLADYIKKNGWKIDNNKCLYSL